MRHVDFSPLYRSTVGFDRLFSMLDGIGQPEQAQAYPPYNIERTGDNAYRITMAVAGFDETELSIESRANVLTIKAEKANDTTKASEGEFLYRGIATRAFERRFQLADHVEVQNASLKNGLLHIDLLRNIPEAMKPRRIAIATDVSDEPKQIAAQVTPAQVN
ncbi:Hsp20 family protein [Agrobacterium larrymoorei]|uniref:Hsp20 family protein n=1 Tax=Agrobacterium larrymoorei TaxID=160699 RepID=A0AAF0H793_9HYPH|nr:Hsp20 family protein [Agrobacterium larrymoorei]WHA41659.1 Hsp20 family protein [Agrobacterium larrymoorei]